MLVQRAAASHCFRGQSVRVNRHLKFATQNFQTANVIAMFVRKQNAIELIRRDAALLQSQYQLARAQAAIYQNFAVPSGNKRTISGAAAPEHGQTKHVSYLVAGICFAQTEFVNQTNN